jgi:hypothetical protein
MTKINQRIEEDFIKALKAKQRLKVSVLRMLKSALENRRKESASWQGQRLDEKTVIQVIRSQIKQRDQAVEEYEKAGRKDLAQKEIQEKKILEDYLPEQMTEEEISKIIDSAIVKLKTVDIKQMGRVMGEVMKKIKGQAPGETVSQLVKDKLLKKQKNA